MPTPRTCSNYPADNQQALPQIFQGSGNGLLLYVAIAGVLALLLIAYVLFRHQGRVNEDAAS